MSRQCPLCGQRVEGSFAPGPGGRPDASCPTCGSLERHRFLALLLNGLTPWLLTSELVVDVAPSNHTTHLLERLGVSPVLRLDFDPGADHRNVDVQGSITDLPLAGSTADLIICFHVLEHVPDDLRAMKELSRVLKDGGIGLVQVPWRRTRETDEDVSAGIDERVRRFGQADHVRYYGHDFESRLTGSGLNVLRVTPRSLLPEEMWRGFHLLPDDSVWVVRRSDGPGRLGDIREMLKVRDGLTFAAPPASSQMPEKPSIVDESELARARADADHWQRAYRRLRGRPVVRVLAGANALVRRVRRLGSS